MTEPLPDHTLYRPTRRGLLQQLAFGGLLCLLPQTGCHGILSRKEKCPVTECPPGEVIVPTPRRVFVLETTPPERCIGGAPHQFVLEVVAALNQHPGCNAILLPPTVNLEEMIRMKSGASEGEMRVPMEPDSALEEILLINVLEVLPFRPMRLQAIIERRHLFDGTLISRNTRTWNAPADCEPQGPSKFNRFRLWHPPPLAAIESKEMDRLSPHTFMKNIANEIAVEIVARPV